MPFTSVLMTINAKIGAKKEFDDFHQDLPRNGPPADDQRCGEVHFKP